jgi:hypothetical protein
MSEPPRHSSHVTAWTLAILAVAMTYILSVPVVTKVVCQPTLASHTRWGPTWSFREAPRWLEGYRTPVNRFVLSSPPVCELYLDYSDWIYGLGN